MGPSWTISAGAIALYLAAIVTANWLVTRFGQVALPFTAFLLIPFDLIIRDLMQDRWQGKSLRLRMTALILGGGILSVLSTTGSFRVNLASFVAFTLTGVLDALTYQRMIQWGRIMRIYLATAVAAMTDSIIFALIAFEHVSLRLCAAQMLFKCGGGLCWALIMYRFFTPRVPTTGGHYV